MKFSIAPSLQEAADVRQPTLLLEREPFHTKRIHRRFGRCAQGRARYRATGSLKMKEAANRATSSWGGPKCLGVRTTRPPERHPSAWMGRDRSACILPNRVGIKRR